jgi:transposase
LAQATLKKLNLFCRKINKIIVCVFVNQRAFVVKIKPPKHVEVKQEELEAILLAVKQHLSSSQYKILESAIKMLTWLQFKIKEKSISIARLTSMFFGKKTQSLKNLKKGQQSNSAKKQQGKSAKDSPDSQAAGQAAPSDDGQKNEPENSSQNSSEPTAKQKGHGRHSLDSFDLSKITHIPHECLKEGQRCPACSKGILYYIDPEVILVISGQPPLKGEAYSAQGLRCNLCQQIFRAKFPKEVQTQPKAHMSARAVVCLAKYQLGTPLYRLETWLKIARLPISDSEMWEWTESVALILQPIHQALFQIAAKGKVIHNDDTTAKILDLMAENELKEKKQAENTSKKAEKLRKGIFTTALLSKDDEHQIALYITGRKNSGENLDDLLDQRPKDLPRPIQSCDASTQNRAERHKTDVAKCINHARNNFCELVEVWPNETLAIIEMLNVAFLNDRATKDMDKEERLKHHQKHSAPAMNKLKDYCNNLLKEKVVEPNSSFGKAINYLNNHWEGLTLFLRNGEAPLSNNACERIIKSEVLIRKNSYFYKSVWGAMVGDILLSTIKTCSLNQVNPYDYMMAIQANAEEARKNPNEWLPWNYTQNAQCLNTQLPSEEIYQRTSTGPPIITPVAPQPDFEGDKKTLREKAREFFRQKYPEMLKPCKLSVNGCY